ncbi:hypothetical protein CEP52_017787, partial [Fusarium oligoseptatum]
FSISVSHISMRGVGNASIEAGEHPQPQLSISRRRIRPAFYMVLKIGVLNCARRGYPVMPLHRRLIAFKKNFAISSNGLSGVKVYVLFAPSQLVTFPPQ